MFGIDSSEFVVVALVALLVIGPKDLPRVMREVGRWVAKGRAMTRHVRSGFDEMMRQAELEEMQKVWAAQNEAIMKASALPDPGIAAALASETAAVDSDWMAPPPARASRTLMTGPQPEAIDSALAGTDAGDNATEADATENAAADTSPPAAPPAPTPTPALASPPPAPSPA
ncbi:hypothetical protein IP88_00420 [alpha proteobacterium AAP81b]|nr:hypothetical protein IP88_00420 [alpha proteobacterium AAP81b]